MVIIFVMIIFAYIYLNGKKTVNRNDSTQYRYFICFQNKSYEEERKQGILWAPEIDSRGNHKHFWDRMIDLKKDDIVFSYVNRQFVSENRVIQTWCYSECPFQNDNWNSNGYLVNLKYNTLSEPIDMNEDLFVKMKDYLPEKYSPFSSNGKGNQGYLYEISREVYSVIIVDE